MGPSKRKLFKIKSIYCSPACSEGCHFPWKSVWRTRVPLRAAFFVWSAALGKILTMDNLRKPNVSVIDKCRTCRRNGEYVDHLLLHCDIANAIWIAFSSRFGLSWVIPRHVINMFACWWTSSCPRNVAAWKMMPTCMLWCLWREWNDTSFEDRQKDDGQLIMVCLCQLVSVTFLVLFTSSN